MIRYNNISILRNLLNLIVRYFQLKLSIYQMGEGYLQKNQSYYQIYNYLAMPYEYRQFIKANQPKQKNYDQLDLYFFKTKSTGVSIKARFSTNGQSLPTSWEVKEIQAKIIKNYHEIATKQTIMQDWKKYKFDVDFKVFTREYFLQEYKQQSEIKIEQRLKKHLKEIGHRIVTIIRHSETIKAKHLEQNQDLKRWLQSEEDLEQVYAVLKQRAKGFSYQEGYINVIPLFAKKALESQAFFKTVAFEHKKQQDLHSLLKKFQINPTENISYPSLLQKIYSGII